MKKHILSIILTAICTLPLAACVAPVESGSKPETSVVEQIDPASNQDPTKGWVKVMEDTEGALRGIKVYKRCDGTTLIYMTPGYNSGAHGISVIESNIECNR